MHGHMDVKLKRNLEILSRIAAKFLCSLHEQTYTVYIPIYIYIYLVPYDYFVNITSYGMNNVCNNISKITLYRIYKVT